MTMMTEPLGFTSRFGLKGCNSSERALLATGLRWLMTEPHFQE